MSTEFSDEQEEAVIRVQRCKDYYEILGIEKKASDADIRKAYRKLALQFHPDKNKAPGATDAFQMIGNAFAILSDPAKRKHYDMVGPEDEARGTRTYNRRAYDDPTRGFEADISPEDLFNMFFGGGLGGQTIYVNRPFGRQNGFRPNHNHQQHHPPEPSGAGVLLQMMPVIVLICLSLMSSLFVSEPAFSLIRSSKYHIERKTTQLEVPYFVKDTFEKDYKGNIRRVESQVEEDFITNLRGACFREKNYKEGMIWRARSFRDPQMEEKAKSLKTPACDQLRKFSQEYVLW